MFDKVIKCPKCGKPCVDDTFHQCYDENKIDGKTMLHVKDTKDKIKLEQKTILLEHA